MSTPARNRPPAAAETRRIQGVQVALDALSKDVASQLVVLLRTQLAAAKPSRNVVEKALVEAVPAALERAFVTSFLSGESVARERRAVLAHLLSSAELQAAVGGDWTAPMEARTFTKAASKVHEDEELTSEAASRLLHVSRTHLNTLADSGVLGSVRRTDGGHRRISKAALLKYKAASRQRQAKGLDATVAASQKLGLYDVELAGLPVQADR